MGGASQGVFRGGQSRDIFRGGPVKKITLYNTCECPSLPNGWVNGHVSDIKAWLKLKLIASMQLFLLLEIKVDGLADILLPVFVFGIISILTADG